MHDDIGAEIEGPAQVRRGERIVDHQRQAGLVCDGSDGRNIQDFEAGIADGLAEHEFRVGLDRRLDARMVARLHESRRDAETRQRLRQHVDRAPVERGRRHDMVAGVQERRDG